MTSRTLLFALPSPLTSTTFQKPHHPRPRRLPARRPRPNPPPPYRASLSGYALLALPPVLAHLSANPALTTRIPPPLHVLTGPPTAFILASLLAQAGLGPLLAAPSAAALALAPAGIALLLLSPPPPPAARPRGLWPAFAFGALGTAFGALIAALVVAGAKLAPPQQAAHFAAVFAATYIGGAINYLAVGRALNVGDAVLAAGLAADMAVMGVYFGVLFCMGRKIGAVQTVSRKISASNDERRGVIAKAGLLSLRIALPLALAGVCMRAAAATVSLFLHLGLRNASSFEVLFVTLFAGALARAPPLRSVLCVHTPHLASAALLVFFSALGSLTSLRAALAAGPAALVFAIVVLGFHAAAVLLCVKIFGGEKGGERAALVASNALVGGSATAAAYAAAMGWGDLVAGAVAAGAAGYAIANPVAVALAQTVGALLGG